MCRGSAGLRRRAFEYLETGIDDCGQAGADRIAEDHFDRSLPDQESVRANCRERLRQGTSDVEAIEPEQRQLIGNANACRKAVEQSAHGHVVVRVDEDFNARSARAKVRRLGSALVDRRLAVGHGRGFQR